MSQVLVAILKRRLREGKTYEDFRKAWYHKMGFGVANRMLTVLNAADPREIIVISLTEITEDQVRRLISVDASERESNPLDDIIEPEMERTFGILIAEDDFSETGPLQYKPAAVNAVETDLAQVASDIERAAGLLARLQHGSRNAELP
jgi:hypothetical protein